METIMKQPRRTRLALLAGLALAACLPLGAQAQGKPLKLLVGYPAGGAVDVVARQVGEELRASGYTVVVENKAGAAGQLATLAVLQAPADGSTVVMMPGGNVSIYQHVYPNLKYSLADLAPVATVCSFNFGLAIGPGTPAKTLAEFVAWAKANPGKASYGTPGAGTGMHFMGVMFGRQAGIDFQHVPYRGGAAATTDLIGGTLPALATTLPNLVKMHQAGKLRVVGFTGEQRLARLPEVSTFKEQGFPDIVLSEVFAVFASARTPAPVVAELEAAFMKAARQPRVVEALEKLEFDSKVLDGKTTRANLEADLKRWGPVVKASGYTVNE
jgi:tripartite-type tricarboxylate transporter receptor subunit TctC